MREKTASPEIFAGNTYMGAASTTAASDKQRAEAMANPAAIFLFSGSGGKIRAFISTSKSHDYTEDKGLKQQPGLFSVLSHLKCECQSGRLQNLSEPCWLSANDSNNLKSQSGRTL